MGSSLGLKLFAKLVKYRTLISQTKRGDLQDGHSEKLLKWPRAIHFDRDEIRRVNGRKVKDVKAESSVSGTET